MNDVPNFLTHYHKAPGGPLRSLSELGEAELQTVLATLDATNALAGVRFASADYMPSRLALEARMRAEFLARGGAPQTRSPLYFVLGRAPFFERNEPDLERLTVELESLPPGSVSFTYPDSMISYRLAEGSWPRSELCAKPCNGRVFLLQELPELLATYGRPVDLYRTDPTRRYDYYVEAQLWCRPPGLGEPRASQPD